MKEILVNIANAELPLWIQILLDIREAIKEKSRRADMGDA
jgi:hypothetical protein